MYKIFSSCDIAELEADVSKFLKNNPGAQVGQIHVIEVKQGGMYQTTSHKYIQTVFKSVEKSVEKKEVKK